MFREPGTRCLVSHDLVEYLYTSLNLDENLKKIWLEGEITNFSQNRKSRHMYFTIKDDQAAIDAVMFAENTAVCALCPKTGTGC